MTAPSVVPQPFLNRSCIPDSLRELDRWVLWRYATTDTGRQTKKPFQADGRPASSTDPATWTTCEAALNAYDRGSFDGIGFVFSDQDDISGIDLDDCLVNGALKPWAQEIVAAFSETYMEVSPSGTGIKIFCRATLPDKGRKKVFSDGGIEVYDRDRYFTVTGHAWCGAPSEIEDYQAEVVRLYQRITEDGHGKRAYDLRDHQKVSAKQKEGDPSRHEFLKTQAARGRNLGMEFPELLAMLKEINRNRCDPPKPDAEVEELARYFASLESRGSVIPIRRQENASGVLAPAALTDLLNGYDREDVGNGQRIKALFGDSLRYCYSFNKWLVYDGMRWEVDGQEKARRFACDTMVAFAQQAAASRDENLTKFAARCFSSGRITNALREAQSDLAIAPGDLDCHPYLLNFLNGTVDLRTGELHAHCRDHYLTKIVRHNYNPAATCPTFTQFLHRAMGGGPDASEAVLNRADRLMAYLQKALGYSATGITSEKAVFLPHGGGDNGKSTLLATILSLLEDYAVLLQIDSLMTRQESNNTQADLADLRGARFVMTSETEEGQRLAEGKLKRITQGTGRIKATRKFENPIEFPETHKLWIDANHLPAVRGTDNAIWNRLHAIPFEVTIPKHEQDRQLPAKLLAEAEGILAWTVAGAVRWSREGLGKPPEVEQAAASWRAESDQIGRFIEECCITLPTASVRARRLFDAYKSWAEQGSERVEIETVFSKRLTERQFTKTRTMTGMTYSGIGLADRTEGGM